MGRSGRRRAHQAEGGEQGDPLMLALFSLGAHPALLALQAQLLEDERLFAFLDDVYVVCSPDRVNAIFGLLQNALFIHSATQVWNRGGVVPSGIEVMEAVERITDPEAIVGGVTQICRVRTKACGFWAHFWGTQTTFAPSCNLYLRHTTS